MTKDILLLSLDRPENNRDLEFEIFGVQVRVKELGVDFNTKLLVELVERYADDFDVIGISGIGNSIKIENIDITHQVISKVREAAKGKPVVDGMNLRTILVPWSLNYFNRINKDFLRGKRVGFYAGAIQHYLLNDLSDYQISPVFADPYFFNNVPALIRCKALLDKSLLNLRFFLKRTRLGKLRNRDFSKESLKLNPLFKDFFDCQIFVLNAAQLQYLKLQDLTGKTVIIDRLDEESERILKEKNVQHIFPCLPKINEKYFRSYTKLEALFQCLKEESSPLEKNEIEYYVSKFDLSPKEIKLDNLSEDSEIQKFAFIIHPLSKYDLLKIPILKPFKRNKYLAQCLDFISPKLPILHYGKITGIVSEYDGTKVEGDIFSVTETPKVMLNRPIDKMYQKFIKIAHDADRRGNKIIGLGAYTKVVGDAGVTVNKFSPIPVTTGNSLSAAATLWAAKYAVTKMNFIKKENGIYPGTVMVVGATGSIGKVNSKILAQSWKRLILVAPKLYKLLDLKAEILEMNPNCEIICLTSAHKFLDECDLIITTTSAHGQKILDIDLVKPGCVICDVSRPFDISKKDAMRRPDVLVISSGEVELPGLDVKIGVDLGLEGKSVYACLAETALLALDKRYTSFSLSRDISYKKIYLIDQLAKKHGVRLSVIMGHDLEITDDEIELCRQHALRKREYGDYSVDHSIVNSLYLDSEPREDDFQGEII